jgi:hypothetical protein
VGAMRIRFAWIAGVAAAAALVAGALTLHSGQPGGISAGSRPPLDPGALTARTGRLVCGQPILRSPFSYTGQPGPYRSGTLGLPTYGAPGSDFPKASAGAVLPAGTRDYPSFALRPDTVYYLLPGVHVGSIQANTNDAFVGGRAGGVVSVLSGNYDGSPWSIDSNSTDGDQHGVTVEYLTIEKYQPPVDQGAVNQDGNTGWTIQYNTITLNVPGGGIMAGADNIIRDNCLTLNGQYGFQSSGGFGADSLTGGPYNVTIAGNEISYNDTCDLEGRMSNRAAGWHDLNPVPPRYRNPRCGQVEGDGNEGGFKLWTTNGVTVAGNYIHHNWGPGGWADTDNANTTWSGNTIIANDGPAIIEEISYNFSINGNYLADNNWLEGVGNSSFPEPAIYISESGSDRQFGGVPACAERSCARQRSYPGQSVISGNTLVDNGGSIFLWQNSNRYCSDGADASCTLVDGGHSGPFTISACKANWPAAALDAASHSGVASGSPPQDWWDGCMWRTENVSITRNTIDFNPADIPHCTSRAWPACGAGGLFSEYGSPPAKVGGAAVATDLTFFQDNHWSRNTYNGPSTFYAWNQGNGDNPVSWAAWTGDVTAGARCGTHSNLQSGYCTGPFGQDAGSTYRSTPPRHIR